MTCISKEYCKLFVPGIFTVTLWLVCELPYQELIISVWFMYGKQGNNEEKFPLLSLLFNAISIINFESVSGIQVKVFWVVMCSVMVQYQCFRGSCCLHL